MDLKNSRFLDKNNYDVVLISDSAITYNCTHDYETVLNDNKFSNSLKGLKEEEKISEVLQHYLRNSRVMSIIENDTYRGRPCITLSGTRTLRTYIPISSSDTKAIIKKYENDRIKTIYEEKYDSVYISISEGRSKCYLYKEDEHSDKLSLYIALCSKKEVLLPGELEFLKKLIPYLMGTNIGRYKSFYRTKYNHTSWIGNGISEVNHDIICSINAENLVYYEWFNQCKKKSYEEFKQITIDEYVKKISF